MKRWLVLILQKIPLGSALSLRLVKLTRKHPFPIHPKHLISFSPWYLSFLDKKDIVLDVGCGNGQNTLKTAKKVGKIIGFDKDNHQLSLARKEAERLKIKNAKFLVSNAQEKFPFKSNLFDKVMLLDVLEHLNERDKTLTEISRVLKRGGLLLLSVPNKDTSWKKLQKSVGLPYFSDPDHKIEYSKNKIKDLLKKHKFKVEKIDPVIFDTPLVGLIDIIGGISLTLYKKLNQYRRSLVAKNPKESIGFEIVAKKAK